MIKYTENQKQAIRYKDSDLIISASAGSGKTQVLLEKVIDLIDNGFLLDNILMVTFTNKAASEMKSKLENMLNEKFNQTNNDIYFKALKEINKQDICTIDSLCQKLVKEYYYFLNIEPDFEIKDDNFLSILKFKALQEVIDEYINKNDEDFKLVANLFMYKRNYDLFKDEILSFYQFLVSKYDKFNFITNVLNKTYLKDFNKNELITKFKNYYLKNNDYFINEINNLKLGALKINSEKLSLLSDAVLSELYTSENLDNTTFLKQILINKNFPVIRISNKAEIEEIELKEKLQSRVKKIKDFLTSIKKILVFENLEGLEKDLEKNRFILNKFIEIVKNFEEKYKKLKKENNCLDFNDLEEMAILLLENNEIQDKICAKFKFIFVDEYQDTNSIQEALLYKLSKYSKRIMVGDLKQSIYAFRECNPKIFNDKMQKFNNESVGKVIKLNKNFRSINEILSFSNNIFSNLMRKENSNYSYKDDGVFECCKTEIYNKDNDLKPISLCCLNKDEIKGEDLTNKECLIVLDYIKKLLNQKITEDNIERNLTYKDIAIISRKRNDKIKVLSKLLKEYNIPYTCKYSEKIFERIEVKIILAYLKILNNFCDEVCLCSVLKNIYNFTDENLVKIKKTNLCNDVLNYKENDEILIKIQEFFKDYSYFKNKINEVDVKSLIKEIVEMKNIDLMLLKTYGAISGEVLNIFYENIADNLFDLKTFIDYCEKLKDKKFDVVVSGGENSVLIDTFHSTKGLEYNAVIILGAGDSIYARNNSNLIYNAEIGVGIYNFNEKLKMKYPSFIYSIIKILSKQEEFNEEVRLSYVAFTRAKNFLVVVGSEKFNNLTKTENENEFLELGSYLSLIFSSNINENEVDVKFIESSDEIKIINNTENFVIDNIDYSLFDYYFNKEYDFKNSTQLQLKNSVTSLSNEDKNIYNISNFKLSDLDKEDNLALGNCYHYAMENLPFNLKNEEEIHNKIINLMENKILPENVYSYVKDEKLLKAIKKINELVDENSIIYKEKKFMMYLSHKEIVKNGYEDCVLIQGIIDLIIEKEDEVILIDYKTSRLNDYNLIKKYSLQLNLYEKALKSEFKDKPIKKFLYSLFLDKLINVV